MSKVITHESKKYESPKLAISQFMALNLTKKRKLNESQDSTESLMESDSDSCHSDDDNHRGKIK